jgi:hypothetical protein
LGTVYSENTEASEISPATPPVSDFCSAGVNSGVFRNGGGSGRQDERFVKIRTNSRRLDHVADGEPLDGLILGGASRAVGAPDGLDVAAACGRRVGQPWFKLLFT